MSAHAVVLEKKSKIIQPIRGKHRHLEYFIVSKRYFFKTPRGTIVASLVTGHIVVLKKLIM